MTTLLTFLVIMATTAVTLAVQPGQFRVIPIGNHANAAIGVQDEALKLTMTSAPKQNYLVVYENLNLPITAQKKLLFRLKGSPEYAGSPHLTPTIGYTVNNDKKWRESSAPALTIANGEFKGYALGLDSDFRLSDGNYVIRQIKFVLNGGDFPAGKTIQVELRDIRVGDPADGVSGRLTVHATPIPAPTAPPRRKIYFELENDDRSSWLGGERINGRKPPVEENCTQAGFANLLLQGTQPLFAETTNLDEAQVIVYSRVTPGKNSDAILRALEQGKVVIAAGVIPDESLASRSGSIITPIDQRRLPQRLPLQRLPGEFPELANFALSTAHFPALLDAACHPQATVMLADLNGNPTLTRRGNFYHLTTPIGATLEKSNVFFDKVLLRLAATGDPQLLNDLLQLEAAQEKQQQQRTTAIIRQASQAAGMALDGYQVGASMDNFGRFGWRVGMGMSHATLNNDLSISNGDQSFRLSPNGQESMPLEDWQMRGMDSQVVIPENPTVLTQWSGEGRVEYRAAIRIPESWREREVVFEVAKGIDDVDQFFLNDTPAGKTTQDTPNYWMAPRRYLLPTNAIRYGEINHLRIEVQNLRGDAGVLSTPRLTANIPGNAPHLHVLDLNWTSRLLHIEDGERSYELRHSLLTPLVQHRFTQQQIFLSQENIAARIHWLDRSGNVRTCQEESLQGVIYNGATDGAWGAPWLLLTRPGLSRPMLCVFNRQPQRIEAVRSGGMLTGLRLTMPQGETIISAGFIYGEALVDGQQFQGAFSPQLHQRLKLWSRMAFNYPVNCQQLFKIHRHEKQIAILDHFILEPVANDWRLPPLQYAFLPPLTAFMAQEKLLATKEAGEWQDFQLPTKYGPTVGVTDSSVVQYRLDLPQMADFLPVRITSEHQAQQNINSFAADGLKWSCGGRVPMTAWTPAHPNGSNYPDKNIDLFSWNYGMSVALQGWNYYSPALRAQLENRLLQRYIHALEMYPFKVVTRHRQEPFSHLTYPVLFYHLMTLNTDFAPGEGSQVTYADANEAMTLALWIAQQLEDIAGQHGLARANWNLLKYMASYGLRIDDYAFQSSSCRDFGVGAWIDMLNCEYAGMMALAQVAEAAGEPQWAEQALYRAARRAIPTLARMRFSKELEKLQPAMKGRQYQITGFSEDGAKYMLYPANNSNFTAAMDLFDFSQGFPGTLIQLYRQYVSPEIATHLEKRALPSLLQSNRHAYQYLPALAIFAKDDHHAAWEYCAKSVGENQKVGDWPGVRRPFEIATTLWRKHHQIAIREFRQIYLETAYYAPTTATLTVRCRAYPGAQLAIESPLPVQAITHNGKEISPSANPTLQFQLPPGEHHLEIRFAPPRQ